MTSIFKDKVRKFERSISVNCQLDQECRLIDTNKAPRPFWAFKVLDNDTGHTIDCTTNNEKIAKKVEALNIDDDLIVRGKEIKEYSYMSNGESKTGYKLYVSSVNCDDMINTKQDNKPFNDDEAFQF